MLSCTTHSPNVTTDTLNPERQPAEDEMPKPELEFTPTVSFATEGSTSLLTQVLSKDAESGDATVMLTHAPGSSWGAPVCSHAYWEECYIVEGRLFDETLQQWFAAGSYCCRPPGMLHGPYRADEQVGVKEICFLRYPRKDETTLQRAG